MQPPVAPVLPLKIAASVLHLDSTLPGWKLLDPAGDTRRTFVTRVSFAQPFNVAPVVHAGISGFDIENIDAARTRLRVTAVDATGFDVELETWLGTRIWSVDVSWLAIGN